MKKALSVFTVLCLMWVITVPVYADQVDGFAEFDSVENALSIPYLDVPLVDPISQQEIPGQFGVYECEMEYVPNSGGSFSFKEITHLPNESSSNNHAKYSNDGTLYLPNVNVPTVIVLPFGSIVEGPSEVYEVTLKQLLLSPSYFHLFDVVLKSQQATTDAPVLSWVQDEADENTSVDITVSNFSPTAAYTITLPDQGGSYGLNADTITWNLPDVDVDTLLTMTITAKEDGKTASPAATYSVTVLETVAPPVVLDDMEYATDSDAQSAYVATNATAFQSFSESVSLDNYALKLVAQTHAFGENVNRTFSPGIDLSGKNTIKFDARSDVAWSNLNVKIKNSGVYHTYTLPVSAADTWESQAWDISGLADTDKDAVEELTFEIAGIANDAAVIDEGCATLSGWSYDGSSTQTLFDGESTFKAECGAGGGIEAIQTKYLGSIDGYSNEIVIEMRLYFDALGMFSDTDYYEVNLASSGWKFIVNFASDGLFVFDGAGKNEIGTDIVPQDEWVVFRFVCDFSTPASATCDIFQNDTQIAAGVDCSGTGSFTSGKIVIGQYGQTAGNTLTYLDYLKIGTPMASTYYIDNVRAE